MTIGRSRRGHVAQLVLQIARDEVQQVHLRLLVMAADANLAGHRLELRMAKAQLSARATARRSVRAR